MSELEGNELAEIHKYTQTFLLTQEPEPAKIKAVKDRFKTYIKEVLNNNEQNIGILFYKGLLYSYNDKRRYSVEFHLFSKKHWNESSQTGLLESGIYNELTKDDFATLENEQRTTEVDCFKRDPVIIWEDDQDVPGCLNIPGPNCFRKFLNFWLIVPRVQWDFFDLLYQMYTFDIFHQSMLAKFVHFFTIPTNVMLSMIFLAQFDIYGELRYGNALSVNGSLVLLSVLSIAYLLMGLMRRCALWSVATMVVLSVLYMAGNLWYYSYRKIGNPWYNPTNLHTNPLIWSYMMSIIQASSHMMEKQVPPFITGVSHWESLHMFFFKKRKPHESRCKNCGFVTLSLLSFPILSVSVAWFSWPHLIGTEVIYIMAGIGYRPKLFEQYFRIVEKAESFGNPIIDRFPTNHKDIMNVAPAHVESMKKYRLLSENPTNGEVFKTIATLKLSAMYLRKRNFNESKESHEVAMGHLDIMMAARNGYLGKSNNSNDVRDEVENLL